MLDGIHQRLSQALIPQNRKRICFAVAHMTIKVVVLVFITVRHVFQVDQLSASHFAQQTLVVSECHTQL